MLVRTGKWQAASNHDTRRFSHKIVGARIPSIFTKRISHKIRVGRKVTLTQFGSAMTTTQQMKWSRDHVLTWGYTPDLLYFLVSDHAPRGHNIDIQLSWNSVNSRSPSKVHMKVLKGLVQFEMTKHKSKYDAVSFSFWSNKWNLWATLGKYQFDIIDCSTYIQQVQSKQLSTLVSQSVRTFQIR
jgi:hypothetical protein